MNSKKHPVFNKVKAIFRVFKSKPDILDLSGDFAENDEPRLFIANHSAANGPFTYELYFPYTFVPWGTHEMCGNYKERWNYLYHVFYQQKLHFCKPVAFTIATLFAVISKMLYNGAELIPTYTDIRMKDTFAKSIDLLKSGRNVLIFPENSSDGYHEELKEYHPGFVLLARLYKRRTGKDLPICAVYFSGRKNRMVIDKPVYLQSLMAESKLLNDLQIAEFFKDRTNELGKEYMAL